MHLFLLASFTIICSIAIAQQQILYVAAKSGLSIRKKQELAAKVLDKMPYGQKIDVIFELDNQLVFYFNAGV